MVELDFLIWDILEKILDEDEELLLKYRIEYVRKKYYFYLVKKKTKIYIKYFDFDSFDYYDKFIEIFKEKYPEKNNMTFIEIEQNYFESIIKEQCYFERMKSIGYKGVKEINSEKIIELINVVLNIKDEYKLKSSGLDGFTLFCKTKYNVENEVWCVTKYEEYIPIIKLANFLLTTIGIKDSKYHFKILKNNYYIEP